MDIYVLNSDATKVETIITPQECFEAIEEVEINNAGQLSVKLPVKYYQLIDDLDVMAIHAGGDRFRLYVIISRELQGDILSLTGIGYPNYYLSRVGYIKDIRPKKEPLQSLVKRILDGTPWEVGKVSETLPTYTGSFYYQSRLECLSEISQATACEFDFYVAISGNQITKQRVDVLSKLGKNNGAWFEYGSNALEVVAEYDATEVYTQAIGRGKGEEVGDGYGRRIEFTDVEWKKSQGKPVDKPLGENFVNDPTTAYRLPGNKHLLKIIEFDEIEDPWDLLQATYDWLIDNNRPKVQFRTTVADGHTLGLGDIVRVVRPDIGVRYDTRVFKLTRNLLHPSLSSVEFGEKIASTPMDKINSMTHQIGQVAGSVDRIEQQVSQINVDGSTITYGPNEPTKKAEGDVWYKTVDGEVVGLLMWDGQQWVTVVDPTLEEKINAEIEKVQQDVETAKENADNALKESGLANSTVAKLEDETQKAFVNINANINGIQTSVSNLDKKTTASITNLSDNINLKVDKNDVIHQINVSTEGILIDGGKTHITGQTTIDNAVITSAMIKDVNAGKITTGTLNANNVKIINLDVNTLTGNKAKFIQAAFKDANSSTTINAQGILTKNSHMTTALNAGRLEFRDKGGHLTGSIETNDTLLVNDYDDTMLFKILGRRQLQIAFTDDSEKKLTPAISIKQRSFGNDEIATIIQMEEYHTALSTYDNKLVSFEKAFMFGSSLKVTEVAAFRYQSPSESWLDASGTIGFSKSHLWFSDQWNNVTLDDLCNGWLKSMHSPKGYPITIADSTINGNKAFAFRSSEGGNAVVINNANVKLYAKYDLIFGDGYGDALTLNQIRNGYMNSLTTIGYENKTSIDIGTSAIKGQKGHYFSLLSKGGQAGIYWGSTQMYFVIENTIYSVKDILRACKLL